MLVNIIMTLSSWGLCIRILLIRIFLLIPIVKNVLENSKISRTAEPNYFVALVSKKLATRIRLQGTMVTRHDRCCSIHKRILNLIILDYHINYSQDCFTLSPAYLHSVQKVIYLGGGHVTKELSPTSQSCTSVVYLYCVP